MCIRDSRMNKTLEQVWKTAAINSQSWLNSKHYYRGGFEGKMSRREAALVIGVTSNSGARKIREAHKKIMLLNHPDRGGSPFLAAKINEAKEILTR